MIAAKVVHKKNGPSANSATLSLAGLTPIKGNLLVAAVNQSGVEPGVEGNAPVVTGFTSIQGGVARIVSTGGVFLYTKVATSSETEIKAEPHTGGTIKAIAYAEVSGAQTTTASFTDYIHNEAGSKSTSIALTAEEGLAATTEGGVLLGFVGMNGGSGTIKPWTPAEHELSNGGETTSSQCFCGTLETASSFSGVAIGAAWTTERASGMIILQLKSAAPNQITMML